MAQAQHRLRKTLDAELAALGITNAQLPVLFLLEKNPGMMLKDLSAALKINPSAITGLIDRMEEAALVRRKLSAEDERAFHLFASAEGLAKADAAKPIIARLNAKLTKDFSEREIATVARFLDGILDRFGS
jgi:MarR family transcriptional regulator, organic hydroperoxide resistance regulator